MINFSQAVTNEIVDRVIQDTNKDIVEMKEKIEEMFKTCPNQRLRRTLASEDRPGFTLAGDNVGK